MSSNSPLKTIFATLLVVAFGWGSGYIVMRGVEYFKSSSIIAQTNDSQKAALVEASSSADVDLKMVDEDVPEEITSTSNEATQGKQEESNKSKSFLASHGGSAGKHLTIMIGGDVMFDRGIRAIGDRNGYTSLFDISVQNLFKSADIVIANLEGPITNNPSKSLIDSKTTDSFTFTFSPITARALKDVGITVVSLANNHIDNFGTEGYYDTQRYLRDAGLDWFGNPWNSTTTKLSIRDISGTTPDSPIVTVLEEDGFKIALVGYHAFQLGVDRVVAEIKRVSGPDTFTIVMPHWGEEYTALPSNKMRAYARAFIAAGADAVIGSHPHVVAEQEWVGANPVYYSLGNLVFDQYFSTETKRGLVVELDLTKDSSGITLDHLTTHDVYTKPGIGVSLEK